MNKNIKIIIGVVALVAVIAAAALLYNKLSGEYRPDALSPSQGAGSAQQSADGEAPVGEDGEPLAMAADFTVTDAEGGEYKLSSLRGRPVVINFWATWCGYCVKEMPDFDEVYAEYADRVDFMMVNATDFGSGETVEKAKAFVEKNGYAFPVYYDTLGEAVSSYQVTGFPTTVVVDEKGYVYGYATGTITGDALRGALDKTLALYGS